MIMKKFMIAIGVIVSSLLMANEAQAQMGVKGDLDVRPMTLNEGWYNINCWYSDALCGTLGGQHWSGGTYFMASNGVTYVVYAADGSLDIEAKLNDVEGVVATEAK